MLYVDQLCFFFSFRWGRSDFLKSNLLIIFFSLALPCIRSAKVRDPIGGRSPLMFMREWIRGRALFSGGFFCFVNGLRITCPGAMQVLRCSDTLCLHRYLESIDTHHDYTFFSLSLGFH